MTDSFLKVLSSNRLKDGVAVYLNAQIGWVIQINQATVAKDETSLNTLNAHAQRRFDNNETVEFYSVDVIQNGNHLEPLAIREKMRITGPSINYINPNNHEGV